MSDREPVPNLGANVALVDQQPDGDQFLANQSSGPSNTSLRRTDSMSSAASTDAAARGAPRRNWDRLTYGGFGGWFKRLFSSKKRAQHRREVQERRAAWAQSMESVNDGRSLPNLDLLKSKWAGKKLQSAQNELSRATALYDDDDERLTNPRRKLQRLMFLRDNVSAVHEEDVNPGPSAARRAPQTGKGILKSSSPASTSGPVAGDAEIDAQLQASLSRSAGMDNAYESEQAAHDRVKALRDGAGDDEGYKQAHADYTAMTEATYQMEKRRERQSGVQAWKAQGDLAFPIRDVDRKFIGSREKALAFHQGYWKAEQRAPAPTRKVGHDRRVRFDMGDQATEHLLNTPGNRPNVGETVSFDRAGNPSEGRILPTGAYQYEAADPEIYDGHSAQDVTEFNRQLALHPQGHAALMKEPEYRKFAQASFKMRNRPSMSLMSRAQADLDPATRQQLEAKGANYHRSRDEGTVAGPKDELS